jgi:hypothetical protein
MEYYEIQFDFGVKVLEEVFNGNVIRYCDYLGNTIDTPAGGSSVIGLYVPTLFTPPPDPVICTAPADTSGTVVPTTPATTTPVPIEILGAPIRTFGYDDKGQIVRIDYPNTGVYQMLEYMDGRLRKIIEISPTGVQYERHFYYDNWGRFNEETQL